MQNQPNPGAIGVRKPRLSYSNGVASTKKSQRWENLGEEEDFPALSRQEGHGRPGAPARGWSIAPGAGADTREGTPAPVGSAGWLLGGVEMNSLLSQNTLNEKVGSEGGGEED